MVGHRGYRTTPPSSRAVVAQSVGLDAGTGFYGHRRALPETERALAAVVGAWDEEREGRAQATWQNLEGMLRGD